MGDSVISFFNVNESNIGGLLDGRPASESLLKGKNMV